MKIGIVGAGINGIMIAKEFVDFGAEVTIFERDKICSQTSSASSKMLHGGIRYLENFQISSVKESLFCRHKWIKNFPDCIRKERFFIPLYKDTPVSTFKLFIGAKIYEYLSGKYSIGRSKFHNKNEFLDLNPFFQSKDLVGAVSYMDVVMDDKKIINALKKYLKQRCLIFEDSEIIEMKKEGIIISKNNEYKFDLIINATGPWINQFQSMTENIMLVKGSHLWINRTFPYPIAKFNNDGRVIFLIPFEKKTLLGTTEELYTLGNEIKCSKQEKDYLLSSINKILLYDFSQDDVLSSYSGARVIVGSDKNFSKASRECLIKQENKMISVYGGKWTSSNLLGKKIIEKYKA